MKTIVEALRCSSLPSKGICDLDCPWCAKGEVDPDFPLKADVVIDGVEYWIFCNCEKMALDAADELEKAQTMLDYQRSAMRTAGDGVSIINAALGLCGEAGEVADIVKKATFQGHELDKERVCEELGDVLWYVALAAEAMGTTVEELMRQNIEKLRKRYPDGFDPEMSIHR